MNSTVHSETVQTLDMAGCSSPPGATCRDGGVNFSVFSRDASGMELLLFDRDDAGPSRIIRFDPAVNRTYYYWHMFVPGLAPGQLYGYRALEPSVPRFGEAFDREKLLLDPYSRAVVVPGNYSRDAASMPGDNAATAMKSVVADLDPMIGRGMFHSRACLADDRLRDACTWIHEQPKFRSREGEARHLRWCHRKDPVS